MTEVILPIAIARDHRITTGTSFRMLMIGTAESRSWDTTELAGELGVTLMTARNAALKLVELGYAIRSFKPYSKGIKTLWTFQAVPAPDQE